MLLAGDLGELTPEQKEYLENLLQLDDYMISLVSSWADMESLSQGLIALEVEPVNLGVVLAEAVGKRAVVVRKGSWPMVLADPLRLKQIIMNVLDNAVRHGAKGAQIVIRSRVAGEYCTLTIADSTVATSQQRRAMLEALNTSVPTARLGLRISRLLAEAHGGSLRLDPHAEAGTTLHLRLPLATQMSFFGEDEPSRV